MTKITIDTEKLQKFFEDKAEMMVWSFTEGGDGYKMKYSVIKNSGRIVVPVWVVPYKKMELDKKSNKESLEQFTSNLINFIKC